MDRIRESAPPHNRRARAVLGPALAGVTLALLAVLGGCSGGSKPATGAGAAASPTQTPFATAAAATPAATPATAATPAGVNSQAASANPAAQGKKAVAAALAATPAAAAAGNAAANPAAAGRQAALASLQISAATVVRGFQAQGEKVGSTQNLTADTDPDHELGAPGQYTSRTNFQDTTLAVQGSPFDVANGGAVEVFASTHDAQVGQQALDAHGMPAGEVDTVHGPVLLRLSTRLAPDVQSAYESNVNVVLQVAVKAAASHGAAGQPGATPAPVAAAPKKKMT